MDSARAQERTRPGDDMDESHDKQKGLSILDFHDEDVRLNRKRCKRTPSIVRVFLDKLSSRVKVDIDQMKNKSVIICCKRGQNRSAALAALLHSKCMHKPISEVVDEMQKKLGVHKVTGGKGPSAFFGSSGGHFFQWLINEGDKRRRPIRKKRTNKDQQKVFASTGYDGDRDVFFMELFCYKSNTIYIGNVKASRIADVCMDFVVDLSGQRHACDGFQRQTLHEVFLA